jgi:hypothetical protein
MERCAMRGLSAVVVCDKEGGWGEEVEGRRGRDGNKDKASPKSRHRVERVCNNEGQRRRGVMRVTHPATVYTVQQDIQRLRLHQVREARHTCKPQSKERRDGCLTTVASRSFFDHLRKPLKLEVLLQGDD